MCLSATRRYFRLLEIMQLLDSQLRAVPNNATSSRATVRPTWRIFAMIFCHKNETFLPLVVLFWAPQKVKSLCSDEWLLKCSCTGTGVCWVFKVIEQWVGCVCVIHACAQQSAANTIKNDQLKQPSFWAEHKPLPTSIMAQHTRTTVAKDYGRKKPKNGCTLGNWWCTVCSPGRP